MVASVVALGAVPSLRVTREEYGVKGWSVTKLMALAGLAAVDLAGGIAGGMIQAAVGIPGAAGVVMIFWGPMVYVFNCMLIRQFGSVTIMMVFYGIAALPLPVVGPPGFLPKILIGLIAGVVTDTLYFFLRRSKRIAALVIGATNPPLYQLLIFGLGTAFGVPGIERLGRIVLSPVTIVVIMGAGALGGFLGYDVFDRLKGSSVVKRIQAS